MVLGGFINQGELPKVYAASDVFVLPSESEGFVFAIVEVSRVSIELAEGLR